MQEPLRDAGARAQEGGGASCAGSAAAGQRAGVRKPHSVATGLQGLSRGFRAETSYSRGPRSTASAPAPVSGGLANEAFITFQRQRRFELAEQGKDLPKGAALKEWKELPEEERDRIKREVRERRRADDAAAMEEARGAESQSAAGNMLQTLREQASRQPTAAETRERLAGSGNTSGSTKRKRKGEEKAEIPRPVFPQRQAEDRTDRRREMAGSVRTRTEGNKASVTIASSARVSLTEVSARLSAPTLSCDWARREASDSDNEENSLTVDMPAESEARQLMDEDLRRKISSAQVRRLVQTSESSAVLMGGEHSVQRRSQPEQQGHAHPLALGGCATPAAEH